MALGWDIVQEAVRTNTPVYGLTTGVGAHKPVSMSAEQLEHFNLLLLASHRVGQGPYGWLEGGLVTSFEKFAADCELLDLLQRQFAPLEVDEASLAFDAHVEVGQGGHFFGAQHTLERFRDCFWRPTVASTENFDRWTKNGSLDHAARASPRWKTLLGDYEQPPLDGATEEELLAFVEHRAAEVGDTISVL